MHCLGGFLGVVMSACSRVELLSGLFTGHGYGYIKAGVAQVLGFFLVSSFVSSNCRTFSISTQNYTWSEDWQWAVLECTNLAFHLLHTSSKKFNPILSFMLYQLKYKWQVYIIYWFSFGCMSTDLQKMGNWEAGVCWLWLWLGASGVPEIRIATPQGLCHGCSLCGVFEDWWDNWCGSKHSAIIPLPWQHRCQIRTLPWLHDWVKRGTQLFRYKELHCRSNSHKACQESKAIWDWHNWDATETQPVMKVAAQQTGEFWASRDWNNPAPNNLLSCIYYLKWVDRSATDLHPLLM